MFGRVPVCFLLVCGGLVVALGGCVGSRPTPSQDVATSRERPAGRFVVIDNRDHPHHGITRLDLPEATTTPLFGAQPFSRVHQLATPADGSFVVFAYTPPPGPDQGFMDRSGIYRLELGDEKAEPRPLLRADLPQLFHLEPALTPDGRYLFYVKVRGRSDTAVPSYDTTLERMDLSNDEIITIAPDGIWPRVSPDGKLLTFIAVHPPTQQRGLFVSALDGSDLRMLVPVGRFFDVDTPVFSPDGEAVYFSVAERAPGVSWLDQLFGVAYAHNDHNVPSDWWRIPVSGGTPEKVTDRNVIIVHGAFDATGAYLMSTTTSGVYVVHQGDGRLLRVNDAAHYGTLGPLPGQEVE